MAAAPDTGGRGQIVWRVDRIDPGAESRGAQPCPPPNQNGEACRARRLIAAVGDRVVAASGKEGSHSHPGRERRGEMDLAASPRRPPPRKAIPHRAHAEREDEPGTNPGESESATGGGRPAKAPAPGNGAKREAGCQRPGRTARRETGGDSKAPPEISAAIDPANRSVIRRPGDGHQGDPTASHGTRQPRGARHQGDATTVNRTSQGGAGHQGDTAARTSRSGGADRRGTANGPWQPRGARHQGHTAASHRTCFSGCAGRQGDTATASGTGRPGAAGGGSIT